jgi:hypothetical protein
MNGSQLDDESRTWFMSTADIADHLTNTNDLKTEKKRLQMELATTMQRLGVAKFRQRSTDRRGYIGIRPKAAPIKGGEQ